ncbi:unnamed protein product [Fusarium venenatum]|uniref:Uncharacterized protein n=1 Tax=Fusarium venenatum TaxID=56646 RepID=A0A2L2T8T6_9HYPO|nr:uncharacterized protein FVRRES_13229 [Fusarium venenatum]CEI40688.1 unnamed protein product [Fusarium venenatum]
MLPENRYDSKVNRIGFLSLVLKYLGDRAVLDTRSTQELYTRRDYLTAMLISPSSVADVDTLRSELGISMAESNMFALRNIESALSSSGTIQRFLFASEGTEKLYSLKDIPARILTTIRHQIKIEGASDKFQICGRDKTNT